MILPEDKTLSILKSIEEESSRSKKEDLVELLVEDEIGLFAVKWAYDPFITFGLTIGRRDPAMAHSKPMAFKVSVIQHVLEKLRTRKLSGHAAIAEVNEVMNSLSDAGAEIFYRILAKDMKCGIGETTINRVVPGLLPIFSVMRAQKFEVKKIKTWPVAVEPKLDGYRFTFIANEKGAGFFSRTGIRQYSVDHLVKPILKVAARAVADLPALKPILMKDDNWNFMLDGEMLAGGSFNETSGALRRESETAEKAKFHIFDMMCLDDFNAEGSVGLTYMGRRTLVDEFVAYAALEDLSDVITKTPRYICMSENEIHSFYEKFRERGLEGAMVKRLDGLYDKKKSHGWMKIKPEQTLDLSIIGAFPGEVGTKYESQLGGLVVFHKGVHVRVGGGFTDEERVTFWDQIRRDIARYDKALVKQEKDATIVTGGFLDGNELLFNLAEVLFHEVTPDRSLRHPRFIRLRGDKRNDPDGQQEAA